MYRVTPELTPHPTPSQNCRQPLGALQSQRLRRDTREHPKDQNVPFPLPCPLRASPAAVPVARIVLQSSTVTPVKVVSLSRGYCPGEQEKEGERQRSHLQCMEKAQVSPAGTA